MDVWKVIDNTATVAGDDLVLSQLGEDEWAVHTGPTLLMSSEDHHSEEALANLAIKQAGDVKRVLIGGLGMGFTLRAALNGLPDDAQAVLAETSSCIVRWNRTYIAHLAGRPLEDPRVRVELGDVRDRIAESHGDYDVILLDADNGPSALVHSTNDNLYSDTGNRAAFEALRPGGVLAAWSRWPDESYVQRLRDAGFDAAPVEIPASGENQPTYIVFLATKPPAG